MRVLLVDDEYELVSALAERLGFRGIEAEFETTPVAALALAEKKTFDVAVLDVKMPGMNGIELYSKMQKIQPGLKVVFLTGHGSLDDFQTGAAQGEAYLVKPVDIDVLLEVIDKGMGTERSNEQ